MTDDPRTEVPCDHDAECAPDRAGCQFIQFVRAYIACACGGWDEKFTSRNGSIRLDGRKNHVRACPTRTEGVAEREAAFREAFRMAADAYWDHFSGHAPARVVNETIRWLRERGKTAGAYDRLTRTAPTEPDTLVRIRWYAESRAITDQALGRDSLDWLDALVLIERAEARLAAETGQSRTATTNQGDTMHITPSIYALLEDWDANSEDDNFSKGQAAEELRAALIVGRDPIEGVDRAGNPLDSNRDGVIDGPDTPTSISHQDQ